jgi:glycosyltransferase involved in cell wall biosynthesis
VIEQPRVPVSALARTPGRDEPLDSGSSVTIVVSTRDRWKLLASNALKAALLQEHVDIEVIVVDDGSTEEAPRGLPGLADPRVRLVRHLLPRGVAATRNTGIREAVGDWIAFLDDDDLWAPTKLRRQLDAVEAVRADFGYAGAIWVDQRHQLVHGHAPPSPNTLARELLCWNVLWGGASNVIARRDLLESSGGFDETLFQLADWDLWIRLALAAPAAVVDDVLVALVVHRESMLLVDRSDVFLELDHLVDKHREAASRAGVEIDRARFARWVASGHLRAGRRRAAARAYVRRTTALGNMVRAAGTFLGPAPYASASELRGAVPGALGAGERTAERPSWLDLYV